ncbi:MULTISPECIES: gamma-glutamyl-gamma-aminobutyrate hydrolase family protein [Subtercola]|uniref:Gamma-glutamyl-gamma-aminobutyrate hydrolase family protein n=1 Tax=Subtercola vilae TaxID=2056433 RepID=A0A4T2BTB6_9MICO|nr:MULTISPECIES: gamma-glutamyl-gamma-aminobutyrate hydrolase family protein [Subtercola]MEA9985209.1 gamma-glutamyl-gamma-aminobutyrate hydrolase family protein [Subtercola sp. RTI3]TIH34550.1 gamma-glutamyl-gamma-aminobutyrate hydrolase family protein [Subtercola vilae]
MTLTSAAPGAVFGSITRTPEARAEHLERRRLVVVEVSAHRPTRPEYHSYVDVLNSRVVREATELGFEVTRLAAADLGPRALLALTDDADAVVIMGGEDVDPRFYGGASGYPAEGAHSTEADLGQIALVRRAVERKTPLLGICRGHQIINVALGGTLTQHLDETGLHRRTGVAVSATMSSHAVELDAASTLAARFGSTGIRVQSAHHQAVSTLGEGLMVAAVAPDGTAEALEHITAPVLGVQWHPEDPGAPAGQLRVLLTALVAARV